jgi:hypothetical protein
VAAFAENQRAELACVPRFFLMLYFFLQTAHVERDIFGFDDPVYTHLFGFLTNLDSRTILFQNSTIEGYEQEYSIRLGQMINSFLFGFSQQLRVESSMG